MQKEPNANNTTIKEEINDSQDQQSLKLPPSNSQEEIEANED